MSLFCTVLTVLTLSLCAMAPTPPEQLERGTGPSESREAADAQPSDSQPSGSLGLFSLDSKTITGDWNGRRATLEKRGVRINVFLNDQYQAVLKGGTDTAGTGRNSASIDALIMFDLDKLQLTGCRTYWRAFFGDPC